MSQQQTITDPARIRALAHPLRIELLQLLDEAGEATATQCAERTGESVANCSFHLRTLAKAGYIERGEARGREKPWKPVSAHGRRLDVDPASPGSLRAVSEVAGITLLREADRFRDFLARHDHQPSGWHHTVALTTSTFWATADELRELVEAVNALTDRFDGRAADPATRPEGSRIARLLAAVNPDDFGSEPDPTTTAQTQES